MHLPTREEINVNGTLDERHACEIFYGKTLEQAEALFRENSLYYQEDLMWMGMAAFQFYVQAVIRYLRSQESTGDSDAVKCFAALLEFRLERERDELRSVSQELGYVCRYIVTHYDRFEVNPAIYGDLKPRYESLIQRFRLNS